jgi:hypothetical protein
MLWPRGSQPSAHLSQDRIEASVRRCVQGGHQRLRLCSSRCLANSVTSSRRAFAAAPGRSAAWCSTTSLAPPRNAGTPNARAGYESGNDVTEPRVKLDRQRTHDKSARALGPLDQVQADLEQLRLCAEIFR